MSDDKPTTRMVAMGMRDDGPFGRKLLAAFAPLDPETGAVDESAVRYFTPNKNLRTFMGGTPGTVYDVKGDGETIRPASATVHGRYQEEELVRRWQAESWAAKRLHDAFKARKRVEEAEELRDGLEPVRQAYRRLPAPQRAQLLAAIVAHITR